MMTRLLRKQPPSVLISPISLQTKSLRHLSISAQTIIDGCSSPQDALTPTITTLANKIDIVGDNKGPLGIGTPEAVQRALHQMFNPNPYLLGDQFTTVDIYVSAILSLGTKANIIENTPQMRTYLELIFARPAFLRAIEKDQKVLEAMVETQN